MLNVRTIWHSTRRVSGLVEFRRNNQYVARVEFFNHGQTFGFEPEKSVKDRFGLTLYTLTAQELLKHHSEVQIAICGGLKGACLSLWGAALWRKIYANGGLPGIKSELVHIPREVPVLLGSGGHLQCLLDQADSWRKDGYPYAHELKENDTLGAYWDAPWTEWGVRVRV